MRMVHLQCAVDGGAQPSFLSRYVPPPPQPTCSGYDFNLEERVLRDAQREADAREAKIAATLAQAAAQAAEAAEAAALMEAAEEAQLELDGTTSTGEQPVTELVPKMEAATEKQMDSNGLDPAPVLAEADAEAEAEAEPEPQAEAE